MNKTYVGTRTANDCAITVEGGEPLDLRLDLRGHSPTGFEWGYAGSGPAQLALAILVDHTGKEGLALMRYQAFKFEVVARLPRAGFRLTSAQVAEWLDAQPVALLCETCSAWSELVARAVGGKPVEAVCLNPDSAYRGEYRTADQGCAEWSDDPKLADYPSPRAPGAVHR